MTDPVRFRLDRWKRQLIDLTKRNRLLNFKPMRVTTIRVVDELPTEVFCSLYLEARGMNFLPTKPDKGAVARAEGNPAAGAGDSPEPVGEEAEEFRRVERASLDSRHKDTKLQTNLAPEKLDLNLLRIYQNSTSLLEEQGVNSLFLALGMVEWCESPAFDVTRRLSGSGKNGESANWRRSQATLRTKTQCFYRLTCRFTA